MSEDHHETLETTVMPETRGTREMSGILETTAIHENSERRKLALTAQFEICLVPIDGPRGQVETARVILTETGLHVANHRRVGMITDLQSENAVPETDFLQAMTVALQEKSRQHFHRLSHDLLHLRVDRASPLVIMNVGDLTQTIALRA